MAESIADLQIVIRATAAQVASDVSRDLKSQQGAIQTRAVAMGTVIAHGIEMGLQTVARSIRNTIEMGLEGINRIDGLSDMATKIGVSYNALQDFKYAATSTGSSVESVFSAVEKMLGNIASGKASKALAQLKLDAVALRKLSPEDQFREVAQALSLVANQGAKVSLAKDIFGRGGVDIMNVINLGKQGLTEMSQIVQEMGGHLTRMQEVMVADVLGEKMDQLKAAWGFVKDQIAVGITPALIAMSGHVVNLSREVGGIAPLVQGWVNNALNFVAAVATAGQVVGVLISAIQTVAKTIGAAVAVMQSGFKAGFEYISAGVQDTIRDFKLMGVGMADSIATAFNGLKNTVLQTLKILEVEASVVALKIAKAIDPGGAKGYDMAIDSAPGIIKNYQPKDFYPDLPTGGEGGGASSLLFPEGVPEVDYTDAEAALEEFKVANVEALNVVGDAANETGDKIKAVYEGDFVGDRMRESFAKAKVEMEKDAQARIAKATETSAALIDVEAVQAGKVKEITDKTRENKIKAALDAAERIDDANQRTADSFRQMNQSVVTDMVTSWATGTARISDIVSQWANRMIQQFIQISLFGNQSGGGSITGLLGGLAGGGSTWGSIIGGFFADGGRPPMGKVSVVGENGPELFVPDSAGKIIPNNRAAAAMGGGGGGGSSAEPPVIITIHQSFADGVTRAELAGIMDQVQDASEAGVLAAVRRGGGYRKGMQS